MGLRHRVRANVTCFHAVEIDYDIYHRNYYSNLYSDPSKVPGLPHYKREPETWGEWGSAIGFVIISLVFVVLRLIVYSITVITTPTSTVSFYYQPKVLSLIFVNRLSR